MFVFSVFIYEGLRSDFISSQKFAAVKYAFPFLIILLQLTKVKLHIRGFYANICFALNNEKRVCYMTVSHHKTFSMFDILKCI